MKTLTLLICIMFHVLVSFTNIPEKIVIAEKTRVEIIKESEFSTDLLLEYLNTKYKGYSDVVLKQFILETGWFKSDRFKKKNNISGMKFPTKRQTTAIGKDKNNYAIFKHWTDSVDDYFMLLQSHIDKGKVITNMYSFLVSIHYCTENSEYIKILKGIKLSRLKSSHAINYSYQ